MTPEMFDAVAERLFGVYDPENGGTRGAPKFPNVPLLELWWRAGRRRLGAPGRDAVLTTLSKMCAGGIWDHLGGGFARYSVDDHWLVPHFEKMLSDNAQLLDLLGRAHGSTGDPSFRARIDDLVGWLEREMTLPEGGFATALDADSEGEEGAFYVWSADEIARVLGPDALDFATAYDVRSEGNWEGRIVLARRDHGTPWDRAREARLAEARARLLAHRADRPRPLTDDKVLADWNGMMIHALVSVGRRFERRDWIDRALAAYRFVSESMARGDRLAHSWRGGRMVFPGLASDLVQMSRAAVILAETLRDPAPLADACRWMSALDAHYADPQGGWFLTADDAEIGRAHV